MYYGVYVESRSRRGREAIQILGAKATSVKVNTGTTRKVLNLILPIGVVIVVVSTTEWWSGIK